MVTGIDSFKEWFKGSEEQYAIGQEFILISQTERNIIGWFKAEAGPFQIVFEHRTSR